MAGKGISFRKGLGIDRTGVIGLSGAVPRMFLSPQKVLYTVHIKCYSLKKKKYEGEHRTSSSFNALPGGGTHTFYPGTEHAHSLKQVNPRVCG